MPKSAHRLITVQFASWGSESEINILKPILKDFENKNPNIKVDFMHIPQNYFQKIHLLFASNTAPDVIFINNQYLPIYANAGVLEELKDFDFASYYPQAVDALSWKGKNYGIPRDISNLVIFYNKDIFDKYKVKYPHENWTFEEFLQTAIKITHRPKVFGVSFDETPLYYIPYMTSFGGWMQKDIDDFFKKDVLNYKANKSGIEFYSNLRNKYHVAPYRQESGSATMGQMFLQEKLGMYLSGRWMVPKLRTDAKFDWDVIEFPKVNDNSTIPLDASGWVISKSSKHKKEAKLLIEFLSNEQNSEKFAKSGLIVPANIEASKSKAFLDNQKPKNAKIFLSIIETSVPTPKSVRYNKIIDAIKKKSEYLFTPQPNP
ncbi:sugar ABC transporter substrate-binding protein [bacterium]|nr:sugar ABC transporter substrate-binding protein [bacterium]